jgi:glycosyltransferase involved in cell wall biosynthesis
MKLFLIINFNPFFQNSASANRWRTLIEGLVTQGLKISLYITGGYNTEQEYTESKQLNHKLQIEFKYFSFLLNHNIWLRRINIYLLHPIQAPIIKYLIIRKIKKCQDAIIWTDSDLFSFRLATRIKRLFPKTFTFLEMSEFLDINNINKGNFLQRLRAINSQKFFEAEAFHAYDGLALMTRTLFKHYAQFPEPKPELLHLPMTVDLERFSNSVISLPGFEIPYIAFVGVMNDAKDGVNILIEAFKKISEEFPEFKLYLVGGWNYDTPLHRKLIEEYNLKNKVFCKGEYDRDQIPAIIKNATLLVLPRPDSKQAQGGFPTKLGEYLATGNPVCATTVGEIPDYLVDGESVFFAEPGSVDSFANAIRRALNNQEEAKSVGINGRKVAEKSFNKDIQAKILYDFLKENFQSNNK